MRKIVFENENGKKLNCELLKGQRASDYKERYDDSCIYCVSGAYSRPSGRKERIEDDILDTMYQFKGHNYRIIGYNSSFFSCGYILEGNDKKYLIVETYASRYAIEI